MLAYQEIGTTGPLAWLHQPNDELTIIKVIKVETSVSLYREEKTKTDIWFKCQLSYL